MRNICVILVFLSQVASSPASITSIVFEKPIGFQNSDIYVMDIDERNNILDIRRLTESAGVESDPAWSPDGGEIAFISNLSGNWAIYTMDYDGKNVKRLTEEMDFVASPDWSPDKRQIAFVGNNSIYLIDANGENLRKVVDLAAFSVCWAPEGDKLAVTAIDGAFIVDVKTGKAKKIGQLRGNIDWAKKGLTFADLDRGEIYITSDGRIVERYPLKDFEIFSPISVSPEGDRIVFNGKKKRGKEWSLYILDLRTGRVKDTKVKGNWPDWGRRYNPMSLEPLTLIYTFWSLIKTGGSR